MSGYPEAELLGLPADLVAAGWDEPGALADELHALEVRAETPVEFPHGGDPTTTG